MTARDLSTWRSLPTLKLREAAQLVGVCGKSKFAKAWGRLMKHAVAAKVRPLHFHCARHTFASWALEAGRSIKWVQEMLGHSSAELTLKTYAHLMPSTDDEMGWLNPLACGHGQEKSDLDGRIKPHRR